MLCVPQRQILDSARPSRYPAKIAMNQDCFLDPQLETLDRPSLVGLQQSKLKRMLDLLWNRNSFYRCKWERAGWKSAPRAEDFRRLPFTTKQELLDDASCNPPYGSNLTFPLQDYIRLHHTSGTTGKPLVVLDTAESWANWKRCWAMIFRAAGVSRQDRIYVAFSFGPFVGFWAAFEAAPEIGCLALSGGGQSSEQRLKAIFEHRATVLVCTPSYALYLAQLAHEQGIDPAQSPIRLTIHAGEPGASIPSTKERIQEAWGARCHDHAGASEVGPWGFECHRQPGGIHVDELDFICECRDPKALETVAPAKSGELILSNLNRPGFPVIRYRTGDLVCFHQEGRCACGRCFQLLQGGVLGRVDDMMIIRGVNVYPSAIESVLRSFREVAEFEGLLSQHKGMQQLDLRVELQPGSQERGAALKERIQQELRARLSLRIDVELAESGSLPRYELKSRRFRAK